MHECSNHIQHEDEARGLYVVTHECIIPYSTCTCRDVLTGLYPHTSDYYNLKVTIFAATNVWYFYRLAQKRKILYLLTLAICTIEH